MGDCFKYRKWLLCGMMFFASVFWGCSNAYTDFYSGSRYPNNVNRCKIAGYFNSSQGAQVVAYMQSRDFDFIGESAFDAGSQYSQVDALRTCSSVGGDAVVVMNPEYIGSQTYSYQTQQYHAGQPYYQTSYTNYSGSANYSGNVYGTNGSAYYNGSAYGSGNATTTTFGITPGYTTTQTNYVTTHRYRYGALYFKHRVAASASGLLGVKPSPRSSPVIYDYSGENDGTRDEYIRCFRRDDYLDPEEVCSGEYYPSAKVYWNPTYQSCLSYDPENPHVKKFCD